MRKIKKTKLKAVKGQEKIYDAIINNKPFTLWNMVKYVGYQKIPSMNYRKLIFLRAFKTFDTKKNNNFIAYYNQNLHYAMLDNQKSVVNPLTLDKRAIREHMNKINWPTRDDKPVNQNEHILETFGC